MIFPIRPTKILPFLVLIILACSPKEKNEFKLDVNIKGAEHDVAKLKFTIKDSLHEETSKATGNNFTFHGRLSHPTLATLSVGRNKQKKFYIENSEITIRGNIDSISTANITGSESHNIYLEYQKERKDVNDAYDKIIDKIRNLEGKNSNLKRTLLQKHDSLIQKRQNITKELIRKYPESYVSLQEMAGLIRNNDYKELSELHGHLSAELKNTKLGVKIGKLIERKKNTKLGAQAPTFSLPNLNGEKIGLKSFRGKYVLIDFWASWCKPCREEHPNYIDAYKKFNDQKFTILSISLDRNKEKWEKAVKEDALTWTQLWSSGGIRSEVAQMYNITSIPKNFLLNPEGEIIAKDLRGERLEEKLNTIFM
ncbi:MAG: TlpA disulfide reductase family protein [Balneolaceae bacterium]|nr:TlpA disulfide reductase family protein [Balneolaceae bacterium]